jgi:hypothetical protein
VVDRRKVEDGGEPMMVSSMLEPDGPRCETSRMVGNPMMVSSRIIA